MNHNDAVNDAYEILLEGTQPPHVEIIATAFSVDEAMRVRHGIVGYQQKVWSALDDKFRRALRVDAAVARASAWRPATHTLVLQRSSYASQMVTNHVQAHAVIVEGRRVGALNQTPTGGLLSLEASPFANTLGVAGMVRTGDARWVVAVRSASMAYEPSKLGCSASGSIVWPDDATTAFRETLPWARQLIDECTEELGFRPAASELTFLALTRERLRLGKPQVFMRIDSALTGAEVLDRFRSASDDEHDDLLLLSEDEARSIVTSPRFRDRAVSTELAAALALALRAVRP